MLSADVSRGYTRDVDVTPPAHLHCLCPLSIVGRGLVMLPRYFFTPVGSWCGAAQKEGVWTLVRVPVPTFGSLSLAVA